VTSLPLAAVTSPTWLPRVHVGYVRQTIEEVVCHHVRELQLNFHYDTDSRTNSKLLLLLYKYTIKTLVVVFCNNTYKYCILCAFITYYYVTEIS
jgi:hypothetical protein